MHRAIILLLLIYLAACSETTQNNTNPDEAIEFFVAPNGYDTIAYPREQDHLAFVSELKKQSIPFKYQLTTDGYYYVYWLKEHESSVKMIQNSIFGAKVSNYNQAFGSPEDEKRFTDLLESNGITYELTETFGTRVVVWAKADNLKIEALLNEHFSIDREAIRNAINKQSS